MSIFTCDKDTAKLYVQFFRPIFIQVVALNQSFMVIYQFINLQLNSF